MVEGNIVSMISVYVPQFGLDDSQENDFYDSLINVVRKWGEKGILVIEGNLIGHVVSGPENYENQIMILISGDTSTSAGQVVKKMLSLNVVGTYWKEELC